MAAILFLVCVWPTFVLSGDVVVNTSLGPVLGATKVSDSDRVINTFRGIPFAADTSGVNRFAPPQPRAPWGLTPLNCTRNGPGCIQPHHNPDVPCDGHAGPRCQSEDCLNLNVYCPATPSSNASGYPVMLWIYGGAFNEGMNWGPLDLYDGTEVAARGGVCVVATNYRLGVLGFLVTDKHRGNQAIQDQRMAMHWTIDNIHNFGGNPKLITIWGQSAGAMSVAVHLTSPASRGLFQRAILESNVAAFRYQHAANQQLSFGHKFVTLAGCGTLANLTCLQALDARSAIDMGEHAAGDTGVWILERILEGGHVENAFAMEWSPVVNALGRDMPIRPMDAIAKGEFARVPILIGTNQDEGATFVFDGVKSRLPEFLFGPCMDAIFLNDSSKVMNFYQEAARGWHDARDGLSYVLTDYWFKCSSMHLAAAFDKAGLPAYTYRFQHNLSFSNMFPIYGLPSVCETRTCHASEIPLVFHNHANYSFSASESSLSSAFISYWSAFAYTGDVNGLAMGPNVTVPWPRYNVSRRLNMRMAAVGDPWGGMGVESSKDGQPGTAPDTQGVCDFFDAEIGYQW